jgi:hypothetical protein
MLAATGWLFVEGLGNHQSTAAVRPARRRIEAQALHGGDSQDNSKTDVPS